VSATLEELNEHIEAGELPSEQGFLRSLNTPEGRSQSILMQSTPRPLCPAPPLVLLGGRGGASLGQHKFFCYGSLCRCVGDCVVRHCHLYPLYSWQDILLTFAEMELDSTTMFTPGVNVMFIRSAG
jgi:hypothetical protein